MFLKSFRIQQSYWWRGFF